MADEIGAVVPVELVRGELPWQLVELMLAEALLAPVAARWLAGSISVPLAELEELAARLKDLHSRCDEAIQETRRVYRATVMAREQRPAA